MRGPRARLSSARQGCSYKREDDMTGWQVSLLLAFKKDNLSISHRRHPWASAPVSAGYLAETTVSFRKMKI